jgi:hypothetical protein
MPHEWVLIAVGVTLLLLAARPIQRRASRSAELTPEPVPALAPQPPKPVDPPRADSADTLNMSWLDSLLDSSEPRPREPLDDAAEVASVLRFWLSEEQH